MSGFQRRASYVCDTVKHDLLSNSFVARSNCSVSPDALCFDTEHYVRISFYRYYTKCAQFLEVSGSFVMLSLHHIFKIVLLEVHTHHHPDVYNGPEGGSQFNSVRGH